MLCENCGKHQANIKYTTILNGIKKEMILCEECANKMGIEEEFHFNMPMDFPSFLGGFLDSYADSDLLPNFGKPEQLKCDQCGMTYDEFSSLGKFGCANCYNVFSRRIDPILKNLQNSNRHVGRKGKLLGKVKPIIKKKVDGKQEEKQTKKIDSTEGLKQELKQAIQEERYEDAAKLRDEIKNQEKKGM